MKIIVGVTLLAFVAAVSAELVCVNPSLQCNQPKTKKIGVLGCPFGRGQPRHGVETGTSVIRNGGFIEYLKEEAGVGDVKDYGDLSFVLLPTPIRTKTPDAHKQSGGIMNTADVSKMAKQVAAQAEKIAKEGRIGVFLGGDHSIAIGSIAGIGNVHNDLSILYVDAHADINTVKTSPSGNLHGMTIPFAVKELAPDNLSLKEFNWIVPRVPIANVAHIGLRSVDALGEADIILKHNMSSFGVRDIDRIGIMEAVKRALNQISPGGSRPVHVSFDVDVLDDMEIGSQTGTPEPGGLTLREAMTMFEVIQENVNIVGVDFTEVNTALGENRTPKRLAQIVKYLAGCAFGFCRGGLNRVQT